MIRLAVTIVMALLAGLPARADTMLRTRLNSDILSTEPGDRRDENTDAVMLHLIEGLVGLRKDGSIAPLLARSVDLSPDGRVYRFTLRSDVVFHNGAALTSAEVVWSLERYLRPQSRWRCRIELGPGGIAEIAGIAAPDSGTVAVTLAHPAPMFLKTLARTDCGGTGILHPDSVGKDGVWHAPIGTGPFRLGEWRRNQFVDLIRFDKYSALPGPADGYVGDKRALVDRVRFMVIPDESSAAAALSRGTLDVFDNVSPTELGAVHDEDDIHLETAPTMDSALLLIQTNDPTLSDARLRRALALTIDTEALTKAVSWGTSRPNQSPIPAVSPYYGSVEAALRAPDLGEARRLVKAAGYAGQPIVMITNRKYPQMFDAAVLAQAMARQGGINLRIETLDWATQLARYNSGAYQIMAFAFSPRLDPSLSFGVLIGDKARDPRKVWDTPLARDLLRRSMETDDRAARQAAFDDLNRAFLEDVPAIEFYNASRITALRNTVRGFTGWSGALPRLWGVSISDPA